MRQIKAVIVDDEPLALENLKIILDQFPNVDLVYESTDVLAALEFLGLTEGIDVILIDIAMPLLNGVEASERIFELNPAIKIIFVTAYPDYVMSSFNANTVDYILKPVTANRLRRTLHKVEKVLLEEEKRAATRRDSEGEKKSKIVGMKDNRFFIFAPEDGYYIKVQERDLILVTGKGNYRLKHNLNYWEGRLKEYGWFRCHRAFLINLNRVKTIAPMFNSTFSVWIEGVAEEIPVSRSYAAQFRDLLDM